MWPHTQGVQILWRPLSSPCARSSSCSSIPNMCQTDSGELRGWWSFPVLAPTPGAESHLGRSSFPFPPPLQAQFCIVPLFLSSEKHKCGMLPKRSRPHFIWLLLNGGTGVTQGLVNHAEWSQSSYSNKPWVSGHRNRLDNKYETVPVTRIRTVP